MEIRPVRYDDADAQALIARLQDFYTGRYGGPDDDPMDPASFEPPRGIYLLGYADARPVAMGAWRREGVVRLETSATAEIKRMYVVPEAARQGLARLMLAHLEATARAAGIEAMILSTGSMQPEAMALYASSGYEPIEGFGHHAAGELNRCFGKRL